LDERTVLETIMNAIIDFCKGTPAAFRRWLSARLESREISPKKLLEYPALFIVLWFIYYRYFKPLTERTDCPVIEINLSLLLPILKFVLCAGWPFALIAGIDPDWRSKDAARVAVASYASYCVFVLHVGGCPLCIMGVVAMFFPLIFSATVMNAIGSWSHSLRFKK
jgi:hypothetical protein